jgi:hypothetical protein
MTVFMALYNLILKFFSAAHPFLILFLLLGLVKRHTLPEYQKGEFYLASHSIAYFFLLWLFFLTHHYSSKRYFLPIVILLLLWCGMGFWELSIQLSKKKPSWSVNTWACLLVIFAMVVMLPKSLEGIRESQDSRREIGFWLRENGVKHPVIISREPRFAFYARGKTIPVKDYNYSAIMKLAKKTGAHYLIINTKDLGIGLTHFLQSIHTDELKLIPGKMQARREKEGDKWLIYQILKN